MLISTFIMLVVAALVLALASSYLLWFGPAARKPFLHKFRELLRLKPGLDDPQDEIKDQIDPNEHFSITTEDEPLEGNMTKGKGADTENRQH